MPSFLTASLTAFSAAFWLNCPWVPFPFYAVNVPRPSVGEDRPACKGPEQSR